MNSLAQPVVTKSNGLEPLSPGLRNSEEVRFQVMSDYLHDLRTPLVALRGYSRMVLEERVGSLNSAQKEYLGIVLENTDRVVRALNELAQLASLEPLIFRRFDLRELMRVLFLRWRPRLHSRSIQLREVFWPTSCFLQGDQHRLTNAFEEVISKLAGSAEPGAEIIVKMSRSDGQAQIRFSLSLERNSVATVPDPTFSSSPGNYIGELSMVESVVRLHGGRMEFQNEAGSRSSLFIVLPA